MSTAQQQWQCRLACPTYYSLVHCVQAHGWYQLKPFDWDTDRQVLTTSVRISGSTIHCTFQQQQQQILLTCTSNKPLNEQQQQTIQSQTRYALMLDVDTNTLHDLALQHGKQYAALVEQGYGRLQRGMSIWEDCVKTLATTNCSWSLSKKIAESLCTNNIGATFPQARQIARMDSATIKEQHPVGYRAEALHLLAQHFSKSTAAPKLLSAPSIHDAVLEWKGFGPYAARHVSLLLGQAHAIPVDSIITAYVKNRWPRRKGSATDIVARAFQSWGNYAWWGLYLDRIVHRA